MAKDQLETAGLDMKQVEKDSRMLKLMDRPQLMELKTKISSDQTVYRNQCGEQSSILHNLYRKILRQITIREAYEGTTPLPQVVVRNSFYEKEHLRTVEEITRQITTEDDAGQAVKKEIVTTGDNIADQHRNLLGKKPARFIVDAVGTYVRAYWRDDLSEPITLSADGKYYVIRDTFDRFCKCGDIRGDNRRLVKEALFPPPGETGLLEHVGMLIPDKPHKRYMDIRFITARIIERSEHATPLHPIQEEEEAASPESIGLFEISVHAGLFSYLEKRKDIQNGKQPKLLEGFWMIPITLGAKIERYVELMFTALEEWNHHLSQLPYVQRRTSFEKYCKALMYCIHKWFTGQEKRATPMKIPFDELTRKGILSVHSHSTKRHLRNVDMFIIKMLVNYLIAQMESFSGCREAELDKRKLTITFHLDGDGRQPMPIL